MFMKKSFCGLVTSLILLMIVLLPCSVFAGGQGLTAIQWYQKGYDYQVDEKDYDNAIFSYSKAIELNPQNAESYNNRGNAYNSSGQYDLAITDYNKAIELDPQNATIYSNRGNTYNFNGQYDLAIIDYNKAIELNPRNAEPYSNRGVAYSSNGQYDLAIIDYDKAIELSPQNAKNHYIKALTYQILECNSQAIQTYTLFLQYTLPNDPKIETARKRIIELGGTI